MSSALSKILQGFRDNAPSERDKGTDFERFCVMYLRNEPCYKDLYQEVLTYGQRQER